MPTAIITPDQDTVVAEIEIAAPPERVFKALTDEGQLMQWFRSPECPPKFWKMEPRVGGRYHYHTAKGSIAVNDVNEFDCQGEVLELVPPRLLVYTWVANWHKDTKLKSVVRWDLTPAGKGTHVKVTHSNLAAEDVARKDYADGWPDVVESLKKFAEKQ